LERGKETNKEKGQRKKEKKNSNETGEGGGERRKKKTCFLALASFFRIVTATIEELVLGRVVHGPGQQDAADGLLDRQIAGDPFLVKVASRSQGKTFLLKLPKPPGDRVHHRNKIGGGVMIPQSQGDQILLSKSTYGAKRARKKGPLFSLV